MPTSQNGWPASPNLALRPLIIDSVSFAPGIVDNDDVETVFRYFLEQYVARVEPLRTPGCWGFSYRENRNDPNSLSNHSSGTAIDINAPAHPNGVPTWKTFTQPQIAEVHTILGEVDYCLRWGGDYTGTPDAMHVEVNCDAATLHVTAERLRGEGPMTPEDKKFITDQFAAIREDIAAVLAEVNKRGKGSLNRDRDLAEKLDDK